LAKRSEAAICATTSPARQYPQNWARLDIAHHSRLTNFEGKGYFSNLEGAWPALGCWGRPDLADCQSTCLSLLFHGFFGSNPVLQAAAAIFLEECARDCPRRGAPHRALAGYGTGFSGHVCPGGGLDQPQGGTVGMGLCSADLLHHSRRRHHFP